MHRMPLAAKSCFRTSRAFFWCDGKIVIGSAPLILLTTTTLMVVPIIIFCLGIWFEVSNTVIAFEALFTVLQFVFLARCACRDPGILQPNDPTLPITLPKQKTRTVRGVNLRVRVCGVCNRVSRPRDFHCTYCDHCVAGFDHHCTFLGTCIGERTYRDFVLYLCTMNVHGMFYMFVAAIVLVNDPAKTVLERNDDLSWCPLLLIIYVGLLSVFPMVLMFMHFRLIARGETVAECIRNTWVVEEKEPGKTFVTVNPFRTTTWDHFWNSKRTQTILLESEERPIDKRMAREDVFRDDDPSSPTVQVSNLMAQRRRLQQEAMRRKVEMQLKEEAEAEKAENGAAPALEGGVGDVAPALAAANTTSSSAPLASSSSRNDIGEINIEMKTF
eukprot:PhM_4_TR5253/c0_g1_i1/m.55076/K16675/ZDHHC9_14_18; palmitoyltransferase ZDHHC9/14/18